MKRRFSWLRLAALTVAASLAAPAAPGIAAQQSSFRRMFPRLASYTTTSNQALADLAQT